MSSFLDQIRRTLAAADELYASRDHVAEQQTHDLCERVEGAHARGRVTDAALLELVEYLIRDDWDSILAWCEEWSF